MWLRLKSRGFVAGPGGLFMTRLVIDWGRLATKPRHDKPVEDCSALHRGPRQRCVTEGPRQRFVTRGRGANHDKPGFRATPI